MVTCHPLQSSDFESWLPLWHLYLEFYGAKIEPSTTRLTFDRLTGSNDVMGGFIARDDGGKAIGIVHWIRHRSCWTEGEYCYLEDLYVAADRRNSGVGRLLIERVYAEARSNHCSQVYWLTHETNVSARKLYDRVAQRSGFVHYCKMLKRT